MLNFFAGEQALNTKSTKDHEAREGAFKMIPASALDLFDLFIFVLFVVLRALRG